MTDRGILAGASAGGLGVGGARGGAGCARPPPPTRCPWWPAVAILAVAAAGVYGFVDELGAEDLVVELGGAAQLLVRAHRADRALVEDQDQVGVPHRRYPLGDHEDGAVLLAHRAVQGLRDRRLRLRVHRRRAVV